MTESARLPQFIIGGAPRSGTTFLCHVLDRHPEIYVAKPFIPEPKVFMGPVQAIECYRERYRSFFAEPDERKLLGEKTSYYLESETACRVIHETVPDVRLIFLVREPVARAYSNYLWSKQNGIETLSFEEAVELEGQRADPMPPEKSYARPFDYLSRGDYAKFAARYYERFGKAQVRFFLYEDIETRPDGLLEEIQSFLEAHPLSLASESSEFINSARETGPPLDPTTETCLRERMRPLVSRFEEISGLDVAPWGYDG